MVDRKELEKREDEVLTPFAMRSARTRGRVHREKEHGYRTVYQRDRDRIIHCRAFRRLEYKTQVFINHEGDHYRTRLTHTLEVAQLARSIARALGLNEDLTEAIALAHDIGHTPFGHAGEEELKELMAHHGGFDHNIHGLRVADVLERRYERFPGLNLSYEVRESFAKHTTRHDTPDPASAGFPADEQMTLEGQVVARADAIAYDSHDLDDGLASGLLAEEDLRELGIWRRGRRKANVEGDEPASKFRWAAIIRCIIDMEVTDVIEHTEKCLRESGIRSTEDVFSTGEQLAAFSPEIVSEKHELESFLDERFYRQYRVCRMMNKARTFLRSLFREYLRVPDLLPTEYRDRIREEGEQPERIVCDYLAGMTDRYALDEYKRVFDPYEPA